MTTHIIMFEHVQNASEFGYTPHVNAIRDMYLDYVNNFVTTQAFCDHHGISETDAKMIIDLGRDLHERNF